VVESLVKERMNRPAGEIAAAEDAAAPKSAPKRKKKSG
jgi:hypothetical protein